MKIKSALVLPDLHCPVQDKRTLVAIEKMMEDHKFSEIIQLGDFMDFDCISSHNVGKLRTIAGKTLSNDYAVGNAILDRWQSLQPKAKLVIEEGNHDERMLRYLDANPQLIGSLEVPKGLHLKKRGILWVPYWSEGKTYRIGNAWFGHGRYTNNYHAAKHVSRYAVNFFYGHTHDVQSYSLVQEGRDKTIVGQSLGCICDYNQRYMQGAPSNWQQAFGAFHFFPDGYFTYNVVRIFKSRFFYEGVEYSG